MFHDCDLPEVYCNYFIVNKSVHSYDTRQNNNLHIHYNIKKSIGQRTVQHNQILRLVLYLILLTWSLHPLSINNWIYIGSQTTTICAVCLFVCCADLYVYWFLLLYVACLLSVCHCLFSNYARQYLLTMGGQLDKRMLHWQPATCCIFQLFIIICHLANKVLLL